MQKKNKKIGEDSDDESSALAAAKTEKLKKMKVLKIKMDGATKAMRDAGAKKIVYDDDGDSSSIYFSLIIISDCLSIIDLVPVPVPLSFALYLPPSSPLPIPLSLLHSLSLPSSLPLSFPSSLPLSLPLPRMQATRSREFDWFHLKSHWTAPADK